MCQECQQAPRPQEVEMKCMVCKMPFALTVGVLPEPGIDIVCGECNENLEGVFVGDQPTFYGTYFADLAHAVAHEFSHDSTQVKEYTPMELRKEFARNEWRVIVCQCTRDETRWNTEHTH